MEEKGSLLGCEEQGTLPSPHPAKGKGLDKVALDVVDGSGAIFLQHHKLLCARPAQARNALVRPLEGAESE